MANSIMIAYGSINSFLAKMFRYKPAVTKELQRFHVIIFISQRIKPDDNQLPSTWNGFQGMF